MKVVWRCLIAIGIAWLSQRSADGQKIGDKFSKNSPDSVQWFENVGLVFKGTKVGLASRASRWLVPPVLDSAMPLLPLTGRKRKTATVWLLHTDSGMVVLHLEGAFEPFEVSGVARMNANMITYTQADKGPLLGLVTAKNNQITAPTFTKVTYDSLLSGFVCTIWENNKAKKGLIGADGTSKIPPAYLELSKVLPTRVVGVLPDRKLQMYDMVKGIPIGPSSLDSIGKFLDGFAKVKQDHSYGLMDSMGILRMSTRYKSLYVAANGRVLATQHPQWVTSTNDTIVAPSLYPLGNQVFSIPSQKGSLLVSARHDTLAEVQHTIGIFRSGLCIATTAFRAGLLDTTGKWRLSPTYNTIKPLLRHWWIAVDPTGSYSLFDENGNALYEKTFEGYLIDTLQRIWIKQKDHFQLFHPEERKLIGPACDSLGTVYEAFSTVFINGKAGFIDTNGEWIYGPIWPLDAQLIGQEIVVYRHGSATVIQYPDGSNLIHPYASNPRKVGRLIEFEHRGSRGLMDACGEIIFPSQANNFEYAPTEDAWIAKHDTAMGAVNSTGCNIVAYSKLFDSLMKQASPYSVVMKNGKAGMIDILGRIRIANRFDALRPFQFDMAAFRLFGKWGFLDLNESIIVQPKYDSVECFNGSFGQVYLNGKTMLFDKKGAMVADSSFAEMVFSNGWYLLLKNGKYGAFAGDSEQRIPMVFDAIRPVHPKVALVRKGHLYGLISSRGDSIFESVFASVVLNADATDWVAALPEKEFSLTFRHP